jgi:hypothetical protein
MRDVFDKKRVHFYVRRVYKHHESWLVREHMFMGGGEKIYSLYTYRGISLIKYNWNQICQISGTGYRALGLNNKRL